MSLGNLLIVLSSRFRSCTLPLEKRKKCAQHVIDVRNARLPPYEHEEPGHNGKRDRRPRGARQGGVQAWRPQAGCSLAIDLYRRRIYDHLLRVLGPSRAPDAYGTYREKVVRGFPRFRWDPATPTLATDAGRPPRHASVLLGWLTKVARRVAIDVLRKERPEEPLSALDSRDPILAQPGRTMESNIDAARRLRNALDELDEADQELLELAERSDLTQLVEIYLPGKSSDPVSRNTISQRLTRARARLTRNLKRGRR